MTYVMNPKLRSTLIDTIQGEGWDEYHVADLVEMLANIDDGHVLMDGPTCFDANGEPVEVDFEDEGDDLLPHPVKLIEFFGVEHLAIDVS